MTNHADHRRIARLQPRLFHIGHTGTAAVLLALIAAGPATAQDDDAAWLERCRDRDRDERRVFCDVRVERMPASERLRVDARPNGGIAIRAGARNDIEVHARIQAHATTDQAARTLAGEIRLEFGAGTIRTDGPRTSRGESWVVSYLIFVPASIDLSLETQNGPVSVTGVSGQIETRTQNGPLTLRDVGGDVLARTQNGPLTVELSGNRWNGARLDAETRNGPVSLVLPESYSAQLETGTVNGPFSTDVPLTITRLDGHSRRIQTTLGNGGAPIRVVTTNGPASIRRR